MTLVTNIISVALLLVLAGACTSDGQVAAKYSPADCPPQPERTAEAEPDPAPPPAAEPEPVELGDGDWDPAPGEANEADEMVFDEAPTDTINLNTASELELTKLAGVGPALARRIVEYREKRRFEEPDEIRRVRGIGPAKYEKLKTRISVD